jgi:hypothetical protein
VPRGNEQKEANDSEIISDREGWSAIRYLDPESESDRRQGDIAAAIAFDGDSLHSLYRYCLASPSRIVGPRNADKRRSCTYSPGFRKMVRAANNSPQHFKPSTLSTLHQLGWYTPHPGL